MDTFDKILELKKELLQSQLKIIRRYQQETPQFKKPPKRTSKLDIVEDILASSNLPLHISKIGEINLFEKKSIIQLVKESAKQFPDQLQSNQLNLFD